MTSPEWNFPSNNFGQEVGLNDAGIETFLGRPLESLAREILQNSQDAADPASGRPVEVHFKLQDLPAAKFPGRKSFKEVLAACRTFWENNAKTKKFFTQAFKALSEPSIPVLKISDYYTTGLTGSNKEHGTNWHNLIKSVGASDKGPSEAGSFGIGKHAPFACTQLRTVFYGTKDFDDNTAFQGVAKLVTHQKGRQKTQGTGYFGRSERNQPITNLKEIDDFFRRNRTGTDIFVPGFSVSAGWTEKVIRSVIENFFVAIHEGKLVVNVEGVLINSTSLPRLIEVFVKNDPGCLSDKYFQALTSPEAYSYKEDDFLGLGRVELNILPATDFPKRVAMVRKSGMVVYHKGHFRTPLKFAGVFVAKGEMLNEFLRSLEPPSHDDWQYERHENHTYARDVIKKLNTWINDCVKQLSGSQDADQLDAEGMSQFLPDDLDDVPLTADEQLPEGENSEPKNVEIQTRTASRSYRAAEPAADAGDEGTDGSVEADGTSGNEGDGGQPSFQPGGGDAGEGGLESGSGPGLTARKNPIKLKKVRAFCVDPEKGVYRVYFEPEVDGLGVIALNIVGEVGEDKAEISSVRQASSGEELTLAGAGEIGPINFRSGQLEELEVTLKDRLRCAMEVSAHAN